MPKNILTIGPLALDRIAQLLPRQDLLNLRLVCREARDASNSTFDSYFSTFAVLITHEDGLKALLSIADHQRLVRTVRKVIFCTGAVEDRDAEERQELLEVMEVDTLSPASSLPKLSDEDIDRNQKKAIASQNRLARTNTDFQLLTQTFRCFASADNAVAIQIMAKGDEVGRVLVRPWGCKTLEWKCGQMLTYSDSDRPPKIVLKAIKQSNFPAKRLSVLHHRWFEMVTDMMRPRHKLFSEMKFVLPILTHLEMDCDWVHCGGLKHETFGFCYVMRLATSLQSLKLHAIDDHRDSWRVQQSSAFVYFYMRRWTRPLRTLRELEIDGFVIDGGLLCRLIKRNKDFRSLRLSNVYMYCGEGIGSSNDGEELHVTCVTQEAERYLKETSGIDDVKILFCEVRSREMPEFEGWERLHYEFRDPDASAVV